MFGISLQKLLMLAAIIAIAWYGFRWLHRLRIWRIKDAWRVLHNPPTATEGPTSETEEMVLCRTCAAYVPARQSAACGRPGCPFPN